MLRSYHAKYGGNKQLSPRSRDKIFPKLGKFLEMLTDNEKNRFFIQKKGFNFN